MDLPLQTGLEVMLLFQVFLFQHPAETTAITSESTAMNRYGTTDDKMAKMMYSVGAEGLAICRR